MEHRIGEYSWVNALFGAFVGSLLFGMAALATRDLALPIGLHAAYNFGHWLIGEKAQPGLWTPVIEEGFKTHVERTVLISYLIVFGSGTLALWWWQHRMKTTRPHPSLRPLRQPKTSRFAAALPLAARARLHPHSSLHQALILGARYVPSRC